MHMILLLIIGGLVLLFVGGELLVRGASAIAQLAGLSPSVVGLTVVAAGTSMPELVVSVDAALAGSTELAVGNIVGSNIFNIGVILGVAALIAPLHIRGNTVRLEWPIMLLAACQLFLLARDGLVDRFEGGFFALALVVFVAYVVRIARLEVKPEEADELEASIRVFPAAKSAKRSWALSLAGVLAGCGLLAGGAHLFVVGAVQIASAAGVSETVIGLTIVAAGTSLPELAASATASFRGRHDIAVTNVIGSNIFNVLGIAGVTAMVHPLEVPGEVLGRDVFWLIGFSVVLFPLMRSGLRVTRIEGAALLAGFVAYSTVLLTG